MKSKLCHDLCENILFIHSFLGCDTTSRLFGIGKRLSLKRILSDKEFRSNALIFSQNNFSQDAVITAGERALVIIYGGKSNESLNDMRLIKFFQKVATSVKCVIPVQLPHYRLPSFIVCAFTFKYILGSRMTVLNQNNRVGKYQKAN